MSQTQTHPLVSLTSEADGFKILVLAEDDEDSWTIHDDNLHNEIIFCHSTA